MRGELSRQPTVESRTPQSCMRAQYITVPATDQDVGLTAAACTVSVGQMYNAQSYMRVGL